MSERTLRNHIKETLNVAPNKYILDKRLDKAKELIEKQKYRTISEVVFAVGMKDVAYFSKSFKAKFDKSPNQLLKEKR